MPLGAARTSVLRSKTSGPGAGSATVEIGASSDDAREVLSSGDVDITVDAYDVRAAFEYGLRFLGVNIPAGATITTATIQFTAGRSDSGTNNTRIWGEDVASPATYTAGAATFDISNRTKTTTSVDTAFAAWTQNDRTAAQLTNDLATIVQEMVDTHGALTNIAFIMSATTPSSGDRAFSTWDHATHLPPELHVEWT